MTCREKITEMEPNRVNDEFCGGVCGCPEYYGYLPRPDFCPGTVKHFPEACAKCWDREIPEVK